MKQKTRVKVGEGVGIDPNGQTWPTPLSEVSQSFKKGDTSMKVKTRVRAGDGRGIDPNGAGSAMDPNGNQHP